MLFQVLLIVVSLREGDLPSKTRKIKHDSGKATDLLGGPILSEGKFEVAKSSHFSWSDICQVFTRQRSTKRLWVID